MPDAALAARVRALVDERGPLTGAEVQAALGGEVFALWRACVTASDLDLRVIGQRYLRLDRTVEGFARLSPSILREFLTYTVVGAVDRPVDLDNAAVRLAARTAMISRTKLRLARRIVEEAFEPLVRDGRADATAFCVLAAGDIVHGMAHDVPRRESSTEIVVDGSDLDVVVLIDDAAPGGLAALLDEAILARKWLYLRNPAFREEVDYVIKPVARLREQAEFDSFPKMVACKVFAEGVPIFGDEGLYARAGRLLEEAGVPERLRELEATAIVNREKRRERLLALPDDTVVHTGHGPDTTIGEERAGLA